MTSPTGNKSADASCHGGFTLIELILVMAMLLIVLSVAFPSLQHFFRGRNLDSEARRLLALTRYGQTRAVSEATPMVLWLDTRNRSYGLQAAAGYAETDSKAVALLLDQDLQLEVPPPMVATPSAQRTAGTMGGRSDLPMIHFSPDGSITDPSPDRILIRQGRSDAVWIVQSANRLHYEIQATNPADVGR